MKADPQGAIARIRAFLATDSRSWTAQELGRELGLTTHQTANTLLYLADRGEVARRRLNRNRSTYRGIPATSRPDTTTKEMSA